MKYSTLFAPLAAVAIILSAAAGLGACSSDDSSNPQPVVRDSGAAGDSTTGGDTSTGGDTGTTDSAALDTGSCMSDAANCNSCYSPTQNMADPFNACSPATASCIRFDNTRVPANVPAP